MVSNDFSITVNDISKLYRIGIKEAINDSLIGSISDFIKRPLSNFKKYRALYKFNDVALNPTSARNGTPEDVIWALNDVSFSVKNGESVGIIGRNGAGKSTLLKILSRVTNPTKGRVEIRGRISSLLEVGTGFHQELSGRENIYLNATILGMRKNEVDRKLDEIIDFSGVEKFIDTPVKRYSSGMKVRLAFSVAAHLEPEILIVDEVLAVGDADFQKKCLNKMETVGKQGRTVLFVSHNMEAMTRLCERAILIDKGKMVMDGPSSKVVTQYLCSDMGTTANRSWSDIEEAPGNSIVKLKAVRVVTGEDDISEVVDIREPVKLQMEYEVRQSGHIFLPHFGLWNYKGDCIFVTIDQDPEWRNRKRPAGTYSSSVTIPGNFLTEGMVLVNCNMMTLNPNTLQFMEKSAVSFNIIDSQDGNTARGDYTKRIRGVVRPLLVWETTTRT